MTKIKIIIATITLAVTATAIITASTAPDVEASGQRIYLDGQRIVSITCKPNSRGYMMCRTKR